MDVNVKAAVRASNLLQENSDQSLVYPQLSQRGEVLVAQAMPSYAELVRMGNSWAKLSDAVACVTAVPTTTSPHVLWNGEPQGGKSYVIDGIGWVCTTDAAAASMFAILAQIDNARYASQPATADSATAINSMNGRGAYAGRATSSHTVTVNNKGWMSIGNAVNTAALSATVGVQLDVNLDGRLIVPPQSLLCVAVIAVNTTALGKVSFRWTEVQLTMPS